MEEKNRSRAITRKNNWAKAVRKQNIDRMRNHAIGWPYDWYDNLHQYSKNKIHCSCPMCAMKRRSNSMKNRTIQEQQAMQDLQDFQFDK
jgi:hypothetical protein